MHNLWKAINLTYQTPPKQQEVLDRFFYTLPPPHDQATLWQTDLKHNTVSFLLFTFLSSYITLLQHSEFPLFLSM